MVHVNDILDFLVAKSAAPSNFGAQLDRLKYGVQLQADPHRQRAEVEDHLLQQAVLLRCIDTFAGRQEFSVSTRQRKAADSGYKAISKIQESAKLYPQGQIALQILRAYHERARKGAEDPGLVAIYYYVSKIAPEMAPPLPALKSGEDLATAFKAGHAKRVRSFVCEAYADALLALTEHVRVFNKKQGK